MQDSELRRVNMVQMIHGGASNTHGPVEKIIVEGNDVALTYAFKGTHTGEILGVPASDNDFEISGHDIWVVRDDKLAESWSEFDKLDLMVQLGTMEPPMS